MAESIDAYYSRINLPVSVEGIVGPVYHKYLIYTDSADHRHILRAGPDHYGPNSDAISPPVNPYAQSSFGPVRFLDREFDDTSPEYKTHDQSLSEPLLKGDDLSGAWNRMRSAFHEIEGMNYQYWPQGVNSNTIIDATLARSGHTPTYRDGTAGNREWTAPDRAGQETINTPGYNHLPPLPEYYESHRRLHGNKKQRSVVQDPRALLDLSDEEFMRATQGIKWHRIWGR